LRFLFFCMDKPFDTPIVEASLTSLCFLKNQCPKGLDRNGGRKSGQVVDWGGQSPFNQISCLMMFLFKCGIYFALNLLK
jgi:hypothetical protein